MNFLRNNLYSSSLFYGLVVFSTHTGNKGDLNFRQLSFIINTTTKTKQKKKSWNDTFKFNCATYDTLDAVKMFLQSESDAFFFSDFTSLRIFYLE